MLYRIALIIYYIFISKLPNSRYWSAFNTLRVWYVSKILKLIKKSDNCIFEEGVYISAGKSRVEIGSHTQINENVFIQDAKIGNYVMIAPNVSFYSSTHIHSRIDIPMEMQGMTVNSPAIIEDDVWIGRNSVILPGIVIGKGSIVGAGSIVTKDVASYTVVGGVPAKFIRYRTTLN